MKYVLLILVILFSYSGYSQTYSPGSHVVVNDAIGPAQATPVDSRTLFYDGTNFIYRPYQNPSEVLSYLNLAKYRAGNFIIVVDSGGALLSNGHYTGGHNTFYMFADSTGNANLVKLNLFGTGGVISFNGRSGVVTPQSGDYTFSQIGSPPTTIAGYGITDAVSLNGTQTLTNKSMSGSANTFTNIPNSALTNTSIGLTITAAPASNIVVTTTPAALGTSLGVNIPDAGTGSRGALTATDWNTFNTKQATITLTTTGTSGPATLAGAVLNIPQYSAGGGSSCLNCNADSLKHLPVDTASNRNGYALTFDSANHKWVLAPNGSGTGITALTGDGTASGSGSVPLTLATVNSNVGTFGSASSVYQGTVNAKGLTTAASSVAIQIAESQVTNLISDLAGKQATGNYITNLTGDVVANGPGSVAATIQANAVTTTKINNNAVTYAKIQAATGQSLLGATGASNFQQITLGTNLSMTGSVLNAASGTTLTQGLNDQIMTDGGLTYIHANTTIPVSDSFFLMNTGQSNAGTGVFSDTIGVDMTVNSKVKIFDRTSNAYVVATPGVSPFPSPSGSSYGLYTAWMVAKNLQQKTGKQIFILNYFLGSTAISGWWNSGPGPQMDSLTTYATASGWYRTDLFLWDQGESNVNTAWGPTGAFGNTYMQSWDSVIAYLRRKPYFAPKTPTLVVGMPQYGEGSNQNFHYIDSALKAIGTNRDPLVGYVPTDSAKVNTNDIHFSNLGKQVIASSVITQYLTLPKIQPAVYQQFGYLSLQSHDSLNGNSAAQIQQLSIINSSSYGDAGIILQGSDVSNPNRFRLLYTGSNSNTTWDNNSSVLSSEGGSPIDLYINLAKQVQINSGSAQFFGQIQSDNPNSTAFNSILYLGDGAASAWYAGVGNSGLTGGGQPNSWNLYNAQNLFISSVNQVGYYSIAQDKAPTAKLDIAANISTTDGNQPIKLGLTSAVLTGTSSPGAIEVDAAGHLFWTDAAANRDSIPRSIYVRSLLPLTYTQNSTNNTLSIAGGNSQTFLTATNSLAGLLDTLRAKLIDSIHNRTFTGFGGGAVSSVSNSDGTLTLSPTTGAVVGSLALAHPNTWTGKQTQPAPIFTGTTSAGANDSTLTIDPATGQVHWRSGTFNLFFANGLQADAGHDSVYLGGTLNQATSINFNGFSFGFTNWPHKTAGGTDSSVIADASGNLFKTPILSGGVTTVGSFSGSSQTNGASISGSTITFGPADATNPGMVSTGTQAFAGTKTFNAAPVLTTSSTAGQVWTATNTAGAGGWANVSPISDANSLLKNSSDPTKLAKFDVSAITTGTTRTYFLEDASGIIPILSSPQNWGAKQTFSNAITSAASINLSPSSTNPTSPNSGDMWWNGPNLFFSNGTSNMDLLAGFKIKSGSFSQVGTATTTFTVTIGTTQANSSYKVNVTPTSALSAALFYVNNKTTTTFDVVYLAGLTGTVTFDWSLFP
jgi:hypothetical protein